MAKVLIVTNVYPPAIGGPSLQTREIALALLRRGWEASVLTLRTDSSPPQDAGLEVHEVDPGDRASGGALARSAHLARAVDGVLARVRPDLVHVQACDGNLSWVTGLVARARRVPRLVKFSADFVWNRLNRDRYLGIPYDQIHRSSWRARALRELQLLTFLQYDLVWATSPFQEDALLTIYGLARSRVWLLPNLVGVSELSIQGPPDRSASRGEVTVALLVSRIVPWKGIDDAIRSLVEPAARDVHLRIVGGGPSDYRAELEVLAAALGVAPRVEFAGPVDPVLVAQEFRRADLFVLPSRYEPFGIVFVQAMAAGLAVVGTRIGGIPSIVADGETGLLVPPEDPVALGSAIGRLAGDVALRRQLGARGREVSRRFSIDERLDDLLAMYEPLLARRRPTARRRTLLAGGGA